MIAPHFPWLAAGVLVIGFASGWAVRGLHADSVMADFRANLAETASDQRALKAKVEAAQISTSQASTARIDQQAAATEKEVQYVEKEVIRYRDRWRDSACRLPAEWLSIYNRSLGVADGAVSESPKL